MRPARHPVQLLRCVRFVNRIEREILESEKGVGRDENILDTTGIRTPRITILPDGRRDAVQDVLRHVAAAFLEIIRSRHPFLHRLVHFTGDDGIPTLPFVNGAGIG